MVIHFVHTGSAYLPELEAYSDFIQAAGNQALIHQRVETVPHDAVVVWWMCGFVSSSEQNRFPSAFHIHEYASSSVGRLAHMKDLLKRWHQPQPDYRIFQNDWVRSRLGFNDSVPFEYRDMGIPLPFFSSEGNQNRNCEFDFVYLGEMQRLVHFRPLFKGLSQSRRSVLLIGQLSKNLRNFFGSRSNVTAIGKVAHADVPAQLKRARYGLNLVPDQLPFTQQTSTKLLEYCAVNLRVVSTDYPWVRRFEEQHSAGFYFVPFRQSAGVYADLLGSNLESFSGYTPELQMLTWPSVLKNLKVWQRIEMASGLQSSMATKVLTL